MKRGGETRTMNMNHSTLMFYWTSWALRRFRTKY